MAKNILIPVSSRMVCEIDTILSPTGREVLHDEIVRYEFDPRERAGIYVDIYTTTCTLPDGKESMVDQFVGFVRADGVGIDKTEPGKMARHLVFPIAEKVMESMHVQGMLGASERAKSVTRYTFDGGTMVDISESSCFAGGKLVEQSREVGRVMIDGVLIDPPSA